MLSREARVIGEGMVVCTNMRPSISRKALHEGRIMEMGVEAVASPKSPAIEFRGQNAVPTRAEREGELGGPVTSP